MPRLRGTKQYLTLNKGLFTEGSLLDFPEGATIDELNFIYDANQNKRVRRPGMNPVTTPAITYAATASNIYYWRKMDVFVIPGDTISFVDPTDYAELATYAVPNSTIGTDFPSVAEIGDNLYLNRGVGNPILLLEASPPTTVKAYEVELYIRDFQLIDDSMSISNRPNVLSSEHEYNLLNAGWYFLTRTVANPGTTNNDLITNFNAVVGDYPSNSDIVALGYRQSTTTTDILFDASLLRDKIGFTTQAPRGHYIFEIGNLVRQDKVTTPADDGAPGSTVTFLANIAL